MPGSVKTAVVQSPPICLTCPPIGYWHPNTEKRQRNIFQSESNRRIKMHSVAKCCAGIVMLFLLLGCTERRSHSVSSPDGTLTLITSINNSQEDPTKYLCVKFQIVDSTGRVLYEEQTGASNRMRWRIQWDGNTRVVLDSSDIGTVAWEQQVNGSWHEAP